MTYTVTADTLPRFVIDLKERLTRDKSVLVDFIDEKDFYINSDEYLSNRWDVVYDMSDPVQYNNFFTSLKAGA
jgi:hypothetical protein